MLRLCLVRDMTWMATCSFELVLCDVLVAKLKQTPKYKGKTMPVSPNFDCHIWNISDISDIQLQELLTFTM